MIEEPEVFNRLVTRSLGLAMSLALLLALTPLQAQAHDISCGMTITTSILLEEDLSCSGDQAAIIVAADDVVVDLGGHRITVTGNQYAIKISYPHQRLTVQHGSISGMGPSGDANGVLVDNRQLEAVINDVNFDHLRFGIASTPGCATSNVSITDGYFSDDLEGVEATCGANWVITHSGFQNNVVDVSTVDVVFSAFTNNVSSGSHVSLALWAAGNWTIADNTFENEGYAGIDLTGTPGGRDVIRNNSFRRGLLGLKIGAGRQGAGSFESMTITDNLFEENHASGLLIGIANGRYDGGVIANNTFVNNGYDPLDTTAFDGGPVAEDGMTVVILNQVGGSARPVTISGNRAVDNANLGINAIGGLVGGPVDGGGNVAHGNGNTLQCVGVLCE